MINPPTKISEEVYNRACSNIKEYSDYIFLEHERIKYLLKQIAESEDKIKEYEMLLNGANVIKATYETLEYVTKEYRDMMEDDLK